MEENIKILEEIVEIYYDCAGNKEQDYDMRVDMGFMKKEAQALENLIKGYREYKNFYHRRLKEWRIKFENQEKHFLNELDEFDEEREKLKKQLENSIPKSKIKEIVDECIPKGKNIITGEEEYQPNTNANSFLTQSILELMEDK